MLIGEVAQRSGISARMLRHYDRIGLVSPSERTSGGYREYSESDMRRLFHVEGLRSLGLSLAQIAEAIDDQTFDPAAMVDDVIERTREQITRGQELVQRLEDVQATAPKTWADVLRTIGLIRGLESPSPSHRQQLALKIAEPEQRDVPVLVEAMLRENAEAAAGALQWAIARSGDTAIPALAQALDSQDSERRRRAFDALVKLDTPAARQVIMGLTKHEDLRIRNRAIIARAHHSKKGSISALIALISTGQDDVEAADALTELALRYGQVDRVVAALARALKTADPDTRRRLVAALNDLPPDATKDTLTSLLNDEDRATALTARFILDTQAKDARA
ncbi:DNA-binding transcriptional regulator, MerR family [Propionibacterium cyclohexanicum]|uniref:DNA-binding transcriptional regulator, MerR family n=1 Tax=Propionibacterium cyclohexanicum TaxID=64702 RepID=A0A1H9TRX0_9ACTN|nr:MerR family transcriptional regulator [Propionibacterium cyclohexanicum]SER99433.1 DNA-binding transcriptional regulator, MerR family [Propionibacterium cyclohexanicum]